MRLVSVLILIVITASVVSRSPGGGSRSAERLGAESAEDGARGRLARATNSTQESSAPQKPDKKTVFVCMMKPFGGACPQDRNGTRQWKPMQEAAWRMFQGWMERMTDTMETVG